MSKSLDRFSRRSDGKSIKRSFEDVSQEVAETVVDEALAEYDNTAKRIKLLQGSSALPSLYPETSLTTGIYFSGASTLIGSAGTPVLDVDASRILSGSPLQLPNGSSFNPAIRATDADSGIYFSANSTLVGSDGISVIDANGSRVLINRPINTISGAATSPAIRSNNDTDSGIYFSANSTLVSSNATNILDVNATRVRIDNVPLVMQFFDISDDGYRIYSNIDGLNFDVGDAAALITLLPGDGIDPGVMYNRGWFRGISSTPVAPTYSFIDEPGTGMYLNQPGILALAVNTADKLLIESTKLTAQANVNIGTGNKLIFNDTDDMELSTFDTGSGTNQRWKFDRPTNNNGFSGWYLLNSGHNAANSAVSQISIGKNSNTKNVVDTTFFYAASGSNNNEYRIGFGGVSSRQWAFSAGGVQSSASSTSWTLISDARVKEQITTYDPQDSLDTITALQLKQYKYTTLHRNEYGYPDEFKIGLIADDVEIVVPDAITYSEQYYSDGTVYTDFKSIDYGKIYLQLIGAVKALSAKVDDLTARIEVLEAS